MPLPSFQKTDGRRFIWNPLTRSTIVENPLALTTIPRDSGYLMRKMDGEHFQMVCMIFINERDESGHGETLRPVGSAIADNKRAIINGKAMAYR